MSRGAPRPRRSAPPAPARQRATRWGLAAERLVELMLRLRGWRVLARRFECHAGEIDLVVRRGRTVAFVEVKARRDAAGAAAVAEAVATFGRHRIARAAALFLAARPALAGCDIRFDVAIVRPWRWPVLVENAFDAAD